MAGMGERTMSQRLREDWLEFEYELNRQEAGMSESMSDEDERGESYAAVCGGGGSRTYLARDPQAIPYSDVVRERYPSLCRKGQIEMAKRMQQEEMQRRRTEEALGLLPQTDGDCGAVLTSPDVPLNELDGELRGVFEEAAAYETHYGTGGESMQASTSESTGGLPQQQQAAVVRTEQDTTIMHEVTEANTKIAALQTRLSRVEELGKNPGQEFYAQVAGRVQELELTSATQCKELTTLRKEITALQDQLHEIKKMLPIHATALNNLVDGSSKHDTELKDHEKNVTDVRICTQAMLQLLVSTGLLDPGSVPESHQGSVNALLGDTFVHAGGARRKGPAQVSAGMKKPARTKADAVKTREKLQASVDKEALKTNEALQELGNDVRLITFYMNAIDEGPEVGSKRKHCERKHCEELREFCKNFNAYIIAQAIFPIVKKADIECLKAVAQNNDHDLSSFHSLNKHYANAQQQGAGTKSFTVLSQLTAPEQQNIEAFPRKYVPMLCRVLIARGCVKEFKEVWLVFEVTMPKQSEKSEKSEKSAPGSEPDANWALRGTLHSLYKDVMKNFPVQERDELTKAKATMKFASSPDIEEQNSGAQSMDLSELQGYDLAKKFKDNSEMQQSVSDSVLVPDIDINLQSAVWTTTPQRKGPEMGWLDVYYARDDVRGDPKDALRVCRERNSSLVGHVVVGGARLNLSSLVTAMAQLREMVEEAWQKTQAQPRTSITPSELIQWMLRASTHEELRKKIKALC